jgi:hypothetical protein
VSGAMSYDEFIGGAAPGASVASAAPPAAAPAAAPQVMTREQFLSPPAMQASTGDYVAEPRLLTPQEGGDGKTFTMLSPGAYAAYKQTGALPPLPTPTTASPNGSLVASPAPAPSAAPSAPPGGKPMTGLAANIGAGTSNAVAATLGAPVDLVTGALNLGSRGIKAVTGYDSGQIQNPVGGSDFFRSAEGLIGADPRNVVPANQVEQLGRAAGEGAASAVLPWSVARAIPVAGAGLLGVAQKTFGAGSAGTQAAAGAVGGAAGQVAQANAPPPLKPLAGTAANMLAGGLVFGGTSAAQAVLDGGRSAAGNLVAPLTQAGEQRMAGARIAAASSDPTALRETLANPPAPLVAGSLPTTYQMTGGADPGLGQLERATATRSPDQFMQRQAQQNAARVGAVQGLAPADASPEAVGTAFRQQLAAIDAQNAATEQTARGGVQQAVTAMGGAVPAGADQQATRLQQYGQQLRGQVPNAETGAAGSGLAGQNAQAKLSEGMLWRAIDPDGTLRVDMTPVRQAAQQIVQSTPRNAAPTEGEPGRILDVARLQPGVQPFSELTALRGRITDAMRAELQQNGRTQTYGRLSQLLDGVHAAMQASVERQAGQDDAAVSAGTLDPEQSIAARINAYRGTTGPASPFAAGRVAGDAASPVAGSGMADVSGAHRAGSAAGGRSGSAEGGSRLSQAPASPSLLTFLIRRGGINDQGGDLAAMDAGKARVGLLRRNGGEGLDYAREAAEEAGYLPAGSDERDLLEAIRTELSGRRIYPMHEQADVDAAAWERGEAEARADALDHARSRVTQVAALMGARLSGPEVEHAADLAATGMHPQEAVEQAAAHAENQVLDLHARRQAFGPEGMPAGATQASMEPPGGGPGGGGGAVNFDAAAAARYQAARAATAQRHATFTNAPGVGQVLAPGRTASEYRLGDSQVPAALFPAGPGAAERAQAFVKAGGNIQDATDYLAFDLRRAAERDDGTLDSAKFQKWTKSRAETFAALPGTQDRFATAGRAQQALDAAVAHRVEAREAFEKSAAAPFLGDRDPVTAVGRILNGDRALPTMQDLARLTANDPAARAGLQRAVVEYMLRDLRGNVAAGDTGTTLLRSDVFQTFVRKTPQALAQIFSPDQVKAMQDVAADLQRANLSLTATKLPGGSNTPQDLAAAAKHGGGAHQSVLTQVVIAEALGGVAERVAGPLGKIAGIGTLVLNGMRQAGLRRVDDLVTQAMLHPELARTLLAKAPAPGSGNAVLLRHVLRAQLRGLTLRATITGQQRQPEPLPAAPGAGVLATPRGAPPVAAMVPRMPFGLAPPIMGMR